MVIEQLEFFIDIMSPTRGTVWSHLLDINIYSQLPPCGHPAITDTPLLGTEAKFPTETKKKCYGLLLWNF